MPSRRPTVPSGFGGTFDEEGTRGRLEEVDREAQDPDIWSDQERAREVMRVLSDDKYEAVWEPYPFNSGYFMCLRLKTVEAEPVRVHLLNTYGIGLISLGASDLRVAFSCLEKQDTRELFDTLYKAVKELESQKEVV